MRLERNTKPANIPCRCAIVLPVMARLLKSSVLTLARQFGLGWHSFVNDPRLSHSEWIGLRIVSIVGLNRRKNLLNLVGSDQTRRMLTRAVQFIVNFQNP